MSVPFGQQLVERDDDGLTPAERRVFALLFQGYANGEAAQALCLSTKTVEAHVSNAYARYVNAGGTLPLRRWRHALMERRFTAAARAAGAREGYQRGYEAGYAAGYQAGRTLALTAG